jgi:hypothetical protein
MGEGVGEDLRPARASIAGRFDTNERLGTTALG